MSDGAMIRKPVDVGNRHLYFECAGQGEPVVMLESGLGDGCDSWEPIWEKLTAVTTVCRYDRAGIGQSDPAQTPRTSHEVVADLYALASQLNLPGPFVVVAHSFGCLHARLFAHQFPDQVAASVPLMWFPRLAYCRPGRSSFFRLLHRFPLAVQLGVRRGKRENGLKQDVSGLVFCYNTP